MASSLLNCCHTRTQMSRLNNILLAIGLCFTTGLVYAQSDNCATATPLTLTGGTICVNGTTTNATSNNTMYGGCNAAPVNEVWYTYVATGTQNDFTIISNPKAVYAGREFFNEKMELIDNNIKERIKDVVDSSVSLKK